MMSTIHSIHKSSTECKTLGMSQTFQVKFVRLWSASALIILICVIASVELPRELACMTHEASRFKPEIFSTTAAYSFVFAS